MPRLIDADALKTVLGMGNDCAECDKEERKKWVKCRYDRNFTKMDFCGWLDDAPTVDSVPVVRCEKCTYSKPFNTVVIQCTRGAESRLKTDYCSYGKRKDGDRNG